MSIHEVARQMPIKVIIFGVGVLGRAIAYDLARYDSRVHLTLVDRNPDRLADAKDLLYNDLSRITTIVADLGDTGHLAGILPGRDIAIAACGWRLVPLLTRACLDAGLHFIDTGSSRDELDLQLDLHDLAKQRGIAIIPGCGLAPGLVNILTVHAVGLVAHPERVRVRSGALPLTPPEPLCYSRAFSVEGVLDGYVRPVAIIKDGAVELIPPLTSPEPISFPPTFHELEAFASSEGISTMLDVLAGMVRDLDYKVVHHKGHLERMKLLADIGYLSVAPVRLDGRVVIPRHLTEQRLERLLRQDLEDEVVIRVTVEGANAEGIPVEAEVQLVQRGITGSGVGAVARVAGATASIVATMLAESLISHRGTLLLEESIPIEDFLAALGRRDIRPAVSLEET